MRDSISLMRQLLPFLCPSISMFARYLLYFHLLPLFMSSVVIERFWSR